MRAHLTCAGVALQLAAGAPDAHALDSHRGIVQYAQTHFDTRDGLPQRFANSIAQTIDGYLWVGSEEGVSRFDGASFTTFGHHNNDGIPASLPTALAVDRAGALWVGTRTRGLMHLVDGEFRAVVWEPGAQAARIQSLTFGRDGDLWVGLYGRGLVRLHLGALVTALGSGDGLPSDDVDSILAARDGTMWIGTLRGLVQWKAGRVVPGPSALDGVAVVGLAQDARDDLWCATANGLAHLHGDTVEWVGADRLPSTSILQLLFDRDHNLWIGSDKGVARMTPNGEIDLLARPVARVLALFEDPDGNLWIGSESGLDRLRDGDVAPFGAAEGATDEIAWSVREDPTGAIWIGAYEGLFRIPPGQTTATRIIADRGAVFAIHPDARGDVWFGTRDGSIGRWHDGQLSWIGRVPLKRSVHSIAETQDGMWLGTDSGLFRIRGGELVEDAESMLSGIAVLAILPDPSGALWLATDHGVMCWNAGALAPIPAGGPPTNTIAMTMQHDPDGTLWVGTMTAGLWRLRRGQWVAFSSKDGMFDDRVFSVVDDGHGTFWMSSNRGIWSVSRQQLEDRASGLRATVDSTVYGEADGMRDRECSGANDPPAWRAHDGRLWFPTAKGLAIIDPAHLRPIRPANALVESVRVDGQPHALAALLNLPPGSGRLELAYTAPAVGSAERLRFRYRLDDFDHSWNDARAQRVAQYTNLPPGDYRFTVEASSNGAWGRAGTIAITLRPQYYQTRWFIALAIAAIVLAIVAVPLLRIRQLRIRARALDRRVDDALRELRATQAQLVEASRLAGRSDVATAVLHNVGNVLNSLNVSATLVHGIVTHSKTINLSRIAAMIAEHGDDLGRFVRDDRRGQKLPDYFRQLPAILEQERKATLTELQALLQNIDHIKVIVASQQSHVKPDVAVETVDVHGLLDDALALGAATSEQDATEIVRRFDALPPARLDRHKALQILTHLLANAREAVMTKPAGDRRIIVTARRGAPGTLEIVIEDNGCGIDPQDLTRIFQLGFTTKLAGQGLGLHDSACAAGELHGDLTASSPGVGSGASFLLVLPVDPIVAAA